jgi:hypothetical protein
MSKGQEMAAEGDAYQGLTEAEIAFIRAHLHDNPGELIPESRQVQRIGCEEAGGSDPVAAESPEKAAGMVGQ